MIRSAHATITAIAILGWAALSPLESQPAADSRSPALPPEFPPRLAPPPPVIRVGTRLVEVEVVVRDRDGPVAGLKKEDFTLRDQGEKQEITLTSSNASTSVSSRKSESKVLPAGAVSNRTDPSGQPIAGVTVLLLDQLNTFFEKQGYARSELSKFLKSTPENERVGIYLLGKELRVIQDFAGNPGAVSRTVKQWSPDNFFIGLQNAADMGPADFSIGDSPMYAEFRQRSTTEAIAKIAERLAGVPGRRNLVWISDAPGLVGVPGKGKKHEIEVSRFLAEANIHLYPVLARAVGPSGVAAWLKESRTAGPGPPPPIAPGDEMDREKANAALAAANGGVAFLDSRDISLAVKTAIEDSDDGYVLGFHPKEERLDNKFHALAVTVNKNGAERGKTLEIRYRPGYFAAKMQLAGAPQSALPPANAPA
jgi:VWFA-related protein